jgi:hypothetical protein
LALPAVFVKLIFGLLLLQSGSALAAPFCVLEGSTKHCDFQTLASCKAALGESGKCVSNREETSNVTGDAPFCMVDGNGGGQCIFHDGHSCHKAALLAGGICAKNPFQ